MVFTDHSVRDEDLLPALAIDERRIGDAIVGRARAILIWRKLIQNRFFVGRVVEASPPISRKSIVAFGCSAFVSSQFARAELSDPRPGLNDRLMARIHAGEAVVLSEPEVSLANSLGTLCLITLYT